MAGAQPGDPKLEDLGGSSYTISIKPGSAGGTGEQSYWSAKNSKKKISNAKSSNKSVATVKVFEYEGSYSLVVKVKKTGTTKLSYKVGGKSHTVKYKVVKYKNPIKSLKVNGKEYASLYDDETFANVEGKTFSGRYSVKLAKGWKVVKLWYWTLKDKMKYFKNGGKLPKVAAAYVWAKKGTQSERFFLGGTWD